MKMNKNSLLPIVLTASLAMGCSAEKGASEKESPHKPETIVASTELSRDTCQILGDMVIGLGPEGMPILSRHSEGDQKVVAQDISLGELPDMLADSVVSPEGDIPSSDANIEVLASIGAVDVLEENLGDLRRQLASLSYSEMLSESTTDLIDSFTPVVDQARLQVSKTFDTYCQ